MTVGFPLVSSQVYLSFCNEATQYYARKTLQTEPKLNINELFYFSPYSEGASCQEVLCDTGLVSCTGMGEKVKAYRRLIEHLVKGSLDTWAHMGQ